MVFASPLASHRSTFRFRSNARWQTRLQ